MNGKKLSSEYILGYWNIIVRAYWPFYQNPLIKKVYKNDKQYNKKYIYDIFCLCHIFLRITFAGFPTTIVFAGTFFVTTLPAPTIAFSPIVTPPSIVAFDPIVAPLQMRILNTFK